MASTLVNNLNSSYYKNRNILNNRPNNVKVLVEDEFDIPFWRDLLSFTCSNINFSITPYSYNPSASNLTKGKKLIIGNANSFGPEYIGCVDSDYDYLLPCLSNESIEMNKNKYILHTYVYSVENFLCFPDTLPTLCEKSTKEMTCFSIKNYFTQFSKTIYPLFIWSLYLEEKEKNMDIKTFSREEFGSLITCDKNINNSSVQDILKDLSNTVDSKVNYFESIFNTELYKVLSFEKYLRSKFNIYPKDTYLYLRGHDLHKFILNTLLTPLCNRLKKSKFDFIKQSGSKPEEISNRCEQYKKNILDIETLLSTNYDYKSSCSLFYKIKKDIDSLFNA